MACHGGLILIKIRNIVLVLCNGRACSLDLAALSLEGHIISFQGNGCIQDALLGLAVKVCALQAAAQLAVGDIAHGGSEVLVGICCITHRFLCRNNGAVLINKGADHNAVIVRNGLTGFVDPHGERADVAGLAGDGDTDTGVATGMLCNDPPGAAGVIVVQNLYNSCLRIKCLRHSLIHLHFKGEFFAFGSKFQIYIDHPVTVCQLFGGYGAVVAGLGNGHKVFLACGKAGEGGCCVLFKSGLGNIRGACCGIVVHFFAIHKQLVSGVRGFADCQIAVRHFQVGGVFIVSCHQGHKNIVLAVIVAVGKALAIGICICMVNGDIDADAGFFLPHSHQCNGGCNGFCNGSAGSDHTAAICPAQEYIACTGGNSIYSRHLLAAGKVFRCGCLAAGECAACRIVGHAIVMHIYAAGAVGYHQVVFIDLMETDIFLVVNMVNTVFYAHAVSTGAGMGQIDILCAVFFLDVQGDIFTVDICKVHLVAIQIGVDSCGVNRFGGILHICIGIFYNRSVLRGAVASHHINGIICIGGQAGEHDVAILLHALYAIDVIAATRIKRALFQGQRGGRRGGFRLLENKNFGFYISLLSVMNGTAFLVYGHRKGGFTLIYAFNRRISAGQFCAAVIICKNNIADRAAGASNMYKGAFTQQIQHGLGLADKQAQCNVIQVGFQIRLTEFRTAVADHIAIGESYLHGCCAGELFGSRAGRTTAGTAGPATHTGPTTHAGNATHIGAYTGCLIGCPLAAHCGGRNTVLEGLLLGVAPDAYLGHIVAQEHHHGGVCTVVGPGVGKLGNGSSLHIGGNLPGRTAVGAFINSRFQKLTATQLALFLRSTDKADDLHIVQRLAFCCCRGGQMQGRKPQQHCQNHNKNNGR